MELDELERKVDSIIQRKDKLNSKEIMIRVGRISLECFNIITDEDENTTDGLYSIKKGSRTLLKINQRNLRKIRILR